MGGICSTLFLSYYYLICSRIHTAPRNYPFWVRIPSFPMTRLSITAKVPTAKWQIPNEAAKHTHVTTSHRCCCCTGNKLATTNFDLATLAILQVLMLFTKMEFKETSCQEGAQGCPKSFQQHVASAMDPAIWSALPPILLQLIVARLPLPALLRQRVLSRHWRALLTSPAFQHAFRDRRPQGFAVVESERTSPKRFWAYDARAGTWHGVPLHYLPFSYLVAADGGLFCFVKCVKAEERMQVVVCNPITSTWRELPSVAGVKMIPAAFQMKVDVTTREYTIKFLGSRNIKEPEVLHIYTSRTNSWTRQGRIKQPDAIGRYILVNVYHGSIHTYDVQPGASSSILYPPAFEHDIVAQVESSFLFHAEEGSLFLLQTHERQQEGHQGGRSKWELLCMIPKAAELENYFFNVFLCGEVILLLGKKRHLFYSASYDDGEETENGGDDNLMLMLDMGTKTWTDVTEQRVEPACLSKFVVELRLDAVP